MTECNLAIEDLAGHPEWLDGNKCNTCGRPVGVHPRRPIYNRKRIFFFYSLVYIFSDIMSVSLSPSNRHR
jgi:hypothetical protein